MISRSPDDRRAIALSPTARAARRFLSTARPEPVHVRAFGIELPDLDRAETERANPSSPAFPRGPALRMARRAAAACTSILPIAGPI
jgi:hypothetical protein